MSKEGKGRNTHPTYDTHDDMQRLIDGLDERHLSMYHKEFPFIMERDHCNGCPLYLIHKATPAQKREALLRAKGLWEEG
jgi:hypothetical protein